MYTIIKFTTLEGHPKTITIATSKIIDHRSHNKYNNEKIWNIYIQFKDTGKIFNFYPNWQRPMRTKVQVNNLWNLVVDTPGTLIRWSLNQYSWVYFMIHWNKTLLTTKTWWVHWTENNECILSKVKKRCMCFIKSKLSPLKWWLLIDEEDHKPHRLL